MKVWLACWLTLAAAESLRGPALRVVHEVHRRPKLELLTKSRRHTELHRETVHGVDLSSLKEGEVNQGDEPSAQILAGAGSFQDEALEAAAAPGAVPQPSLVHAHARVQEQAYVPAAATDAASFVFGGSPPQTEALTRDEVKSMKPRAKAALPAAAQRAEAPYAVTLDLPPQQAQAPPMSALHAATQVTRAAEQSLAEQNLQAEAAKQRAIEAQQQAVQQQQFLVRQTAQQQQEQYQQQTALAATQQQTGQQVAAATAQTPTGITRPKGWDQCLKFSRFIKSQGVTGMELIKTWKSSCEPAVQSGVATERYKVMCNALGGAVEPFASQQDYDVTKMCDSVLAVFHDVTAVDVRAATL